MSVLINIGDLSLIHADYYIKIGTPTLINQLIKFNEIGLSENKTLSETQIKVCIDNCLYEITFHVGPNTYMQSPALIGTDFLNSVEM